jgi:hypothetical protein
MSQIKEKLLKLTELRYKKYPLLLDNLVKMSGITDPVSQILRCHLISESILDALIELVLYPNGEAVLSAKLSYSQKLQITSKSVLVNDIELLPDYVIGSLRKLNNLRNRMAHQLNASVSLQEVMDLFVGIDYPMPFTPSEEKITFIISQ